MSNAGQQQMLDVDDLQVFYMQEGMPQPVLNSISFKLRKGEIVSLLGESGSGKSTIAKALIGLLPPSAQLADGTMKLKDHPPMQLSAPSGAWNDIRGRGIAMLFQDARLALNPMMTIKDQFYETLKVHGLAGDKRESAAIIKGWLSRLHFSDPTRIMNAYPHELSGGMCQRVCLALTLCLRPQVLIADEPTSALDTVNQREVLELIRNLQQELDLSVLLITHDIGLAQAISHRTIVLHKGDIVEEGDTADILAKPRHSYTRRLLHSRMLASSAEEVPSSGEPFVLELKQVVKAFDQKRIVLDKINLHVRKGEIVGILGQSGCGKSTLTRCMLGLEPVNSGAIYLHGQDISFLKGKKRRKLARHIQLVFQDARASLNPRDSALELVLAPLQTFRIGSRKERLEQARRLLDEVGITGSAQYRRPPQLSTGQCQRIAIARALALQPDVLVCDEAVSALDMNVQARILELLQHLHQKFGFSIIMISHDVRVLRAFCHHIAIMHEGKFIEKLSGKNLSSSEHPHTLLLLRSADEGSELSERKAAN